MTNTETPAGIICPQCKDPNHKIVASLSHFVRHQNITCPNCGLILKLRHDDEAKINFDLLKNE